MQRRSLHTSDLPSRRVVPMEKWQRKICWNVTKIWVRVTWRKSNMSSMQFIKHLTRITMVKWVSRSVIDHRVEGDWNVFFEDFREFVIGFLLTTKGSMEEKLDYTFQLYGLFFVQFHLCLFVVHQSNFFPQIWTKTDTLIKRRSMSWRR